MPPIVENLLRKCCLDDSEFIIIEEAIINQDYNLARVLCDGNLDDVKTAFEKSLLNNNTDFELIEKYRALLKLDNYIMKHIL